MNLLLLFLPIPPVLLIATIITMLALMGELKTPPSDAMFSSSCTKHTTPSTMTYGLENGDYITQNIILFSSDNRQWMFHSHHPMDNQLYRISNLTTGQGYMTAVVITAKSSFALPCQIVGYPKNTDFHPHGVAVYHPMASTDEGQTVFVVNHRRDGDAIDVLEVSQIAEDICILTYIRSHTHKLIRHINDVTALTSNSFIASNEFLNEYGTINRLIETVTQATSGTLIYCNIQTCKTISTDITYPNGITLSPDKKYLYVSSLTPWKLNVYQVKENNGINAVALTLIGDIALPMAPDNPIIHDHGDGTHSIIVTGFPKLLQFMLHSTSTNFTRRCSTVAVQLKLAIDPPLLPNGTPTIRTLLNRVLYSNDGSQFSGGTATFLYPPRSQNIERMFMGTWAPVGWLECKDPQILSKKMDLHNEL